MNSRKPQCVFASKVQRTEGSLNHRNKSLSNAVKGVKSAYAIVQAGGQRPHTTAGGVHPDVDIFEDDEDDNMPGPGAYYNPKQ